MQAAAIPFNAGSSVVPIPINTFNDGRSGMEVGGANFKDGSPVFEADCGRNEPDAGDWQIKALR
jgi:hypothetical protein